MSFLSVKNRAESTLASGISDSDLSLTVAAGEGALFPASNFHITIEDEILLCSSRSTDVLTVVRAKESTIAAAHASGKAVELRITAQIIQDLADAAVTEDQLKTKIISLSAANIIAMYATPITVIAAPGAGKAIVIDEILWSFIYGTVQFTGGDTCKIYEETSDLILINGISFSYIRGTADKLYTTIGISALTITPNKATILKNPVEAFADGDGTMKLFIKYRIITL